MTAEGFTIGMTFAGTAFVWFYLLGNVTNEFIQSLKGLLVGLTAYMILYVGSLFTVIAYCPTDSVAIIILQSLLTVLMLARCIALILSYQEQIQDWEEKTLNR
jgi:hypothetical protein